MSEPTTPPPPLPQPSSKGEGESAPPRLDIVFRDLGRIAYDPALALQRELHQAVREGRDNPTILLLEHEPVVTISKRDSAATNLLASPDLLQSLGVTVSKTDRGGDITYHGPGQLVAYPILPLQPLGLNVRNYVRLLEQAVIDTVARFNVHAHRDACAIGVWVGGEQTEPDPAACESNPTRSGSKLAAVGVRVQRWISMHGLALNVDPDMSHFNLIVPCGLAGRPVTSLAQILGDHCPSMQMVKDALRESLAQHLLTLPTVPAPPKPTP